MAKDIRTNLRQVLDDFGYSQVKIAKKVGLTPCKFSNILNKRRRLTAEELLTICEIIGLTPEQLRDYDKRFKTI